MCQRCQNGRSLGYVEQTVDWVNMPVTEVVARGFFSPFFVGVAEKCYHNDVSPRGCGGVPPGGAGVRSTCQVYHWIDRHCEIRHIVVNHCSNTVQELQR